jgi:hypothetical protein
LTSWGLAALIDTLVPQDLGQRHVSVGVAVKAMALNGLGFVNRALYLMPHFFKDKPVERLLGRGITASQLNDDTLGCALYALYALYAWSACIRSWRRRRRGAWAWTAGRGIWTRPASMSAATTTAAANRRRAWSTSPGATAATTAPT